MITCTFNGRLGNNMFQIATCLQLAKKHSTSAIFDYNTWAGHRGEISVDLSMFNYEFQRGEYQAATSYNELGSNYTEIISTSDVRLSGFYQSWKYFESIKDELLNLYYTPSTSVLTELSNYSISANALGISIRRGDYLMLQNNHCVLSVEYYQNAIDAHFQNNIDSIYIFSDDIEWCKTVFGTGVTYVEGSTGLQLFLMTKMKHLIISNSTFAWWGAYLNQNNGIIVAPNPWFGSNYNDKDVSDLYYPTWIKMKHEIILQPYTINSKMYE